MNFNVLGGFFKKYLFHGLKFFKKKIRCFVFSSFSTKNFSSLMIWEEGQGENRELGRWNLQRRFRGLSEMQG